MKRLIAVILAAILTLTAFAAYAQGGGYIICTGTSLEGASGAQVSNIRRAIAKIHGTVIPTGGVFSFNDIVGPRTKAYGFQEAAWRRRQVRCTLH